MTDEERNERDMYGRAIVCVTEVLTDLPNPSEGFTAFKELQAAAADIDERSTEQSAKDSEKKTGTVQKRASRKEVKRLWKLIAKTAKTIARKIPGFDEGLTIPRYVNDEQFFADARAASQKAADNKPKFTNLGMPSDFTDLFDAAIGSFSTAMNVSNAGLEGRGAAVAGVDEAFDRGGEAFATLDTFVTNFYANDAEKLGAWRIASRIERAPRKKTVPPTPPTPPTP